MNEEEVLLKLNTLLEGQRELQIMMIGMATRLPDKVPEINEKPEPVWLDQEGVMDYMYWSRTTFFRRKVENATVWVRKKKQGKWHYLKSSL